MDQQLNQSTPEAACPPPPGPAAPTRYHSLDALRAVALLLGILLHGALAYIPGPGIGWAVQDRSTHWVFRASVLVVHSFRLVVFFLMAGFFARLMLVRLGLKGFILNRLTRVLAPFAAGWLLVYPGLAFAWVWGAMKGEPSLAHVALTQALLAVRLQVLNIAHLTFLRWGFPLTHLWFLYYLLLVYLLFLVGRAVFLGVLGRKAAWPRRLDRIVGWLIETRWTVVILAAGTAAILRGMWTWGIDTPDKRFQPQGSVLLIYGLVFCLGWMLHRQTGLLEIIRRRWPVNLVGGVVVILPALLLSGYEGSGPRLHLREIRLVYLFVYALMMWSWVLALLGIFLRFLSQESRFWRYLSDSSYWLYIVHLPVVVTLQVALARLPIPCGVKFGLVSVLATALSLGTYHCLVRPTPVGTLLNGRRYPFCWVPWAKPSKR